MHVIPTYRTINNNILHTQSHLNRTIIILLITITTFNIQSPSKSK